MFLFRFSMMMMMTTMMMLVLLSLMASGGSANAQQQQQQQSSTAGVSNSLIDSPPPASPFCSSSVPDGEPFYALMVDAGSSGSEILLYTWSGDDPLGPITEIIPPYEDIPDQQFKVEPGISSYAATDGVGAGRSLQPLIDAAKSIINYSNMHTGTFADWSRIPLIISSTAGMRSVTPRSAQLAILEDITQYLSDPAHSPFALEAVTIISGEQEAVYGGVSINHGIQNRNEPQNWYGFLEMGGASTQYTVYYPEVLVNTQTLLIDYHDSVSVFAQSYPNYGKVAMRRRYVEALILSRHNTTTTHTDTDDDTTYMAACFQEDYLKPFTINTTMLFALKEHQMVGDGSMIVAEEQDLTSVNNGNTTTTTGGEDLGVVMIQGSGKPEECIAAIDPLLHLDYFCALQPCGILGRTIPPYLEEKTYVAVGAFFYDTRNLGLIDGDHGVSTNQQLLNAASTLCQQPLAQDAGRFAKQQCFSSLYESRVLSSYGFPDDQPITFAEILNNRTASWTYGQIFDLRRVAVLSCPEDNPYIVAYKLEEAEHDENNKSSASSASSPSSTSYHYYSSLLCVILSSFVVTMMSSPHHH